MFCGWWRDAAEITNVSYNERVFPRTRMAFKHGDAHVRAVLAGGACSDQHFCYLAETPSSACAVSVILVEYRALGSSGLALCRFFVEQPKFAFLPSPAHAGVVCVTQ